MAYRILESWEAPYFRDLVHYEENRDDVYNEVLFPISRFDDADIVCYRRGDFRKWSGYDKKSPSEARYQEYLAERAKRKDEFDEWFDKEMNRDRDWFRLDMETGEIVHTLPKKTWKKIRKLGKRYNKSVKQVLDTCIEMLLNRFDNLE